MYVCLCTGVTSHQIEEAIRNGAKTAEEITMQTGAGSNCGSCLNSVVAMVVSAQEQAIVSNEVVVSIQTVNLPILIAA